MKKSIIFTIALAAATLTSCNMDLQPQGVINSSEGLQKLNDVAGFRNMIYVNMRNFVTGGYFTYPEIQADMFNGIVLNGNRGGNFANGSILSSDSDIEGYWATLYRNINNCNYLIEQGEDLLAKLKEDNNEDSANAVARYVAEAHFMRAYFYGEMFDRFCQAYTTERGSQPALGLPLVTVYNPTADRSTYPGRSTMDETLALINDDLAKATAGIEAWEALSATNAPKPMDTRISSYTIKAFRARLALWIGDNTTALAMAKDVIENGPYALTKRADYKKLWLNDEGTEIIFMPYEIVGELGAATGLTWLSIYENAADYIPTPTLISNLAAAGLSSLTGARDIRYEVYLAPRDLTNEGATYTTICFNKFPGNPDLMTSSTPNVVNKGKCFRLSELYLIAAEAAAATNNETDANKYLTDLRKERIRGYKDVTYNGAALRDEIRAERGLELVGEGFRLSDLRRWGLGFTRQGQDKYSNADVVKILVPAGLNVTYQSGDYRYTWPIPSGEMQTNPQLAGQQNPGY